MTTSFASTSLDSLLDEDPDPDLIRNGPGVTNSWFKFFEPESGTYGFKTASVTYKPIYS